MVEHASIAAIKTWSLHRNKDWSNKHSRSLPCQLLLSEREALHRDRAELQEHEAAPEGHLKSAEVAVCKGGHQILWKKDGKSYNWGRGPSLIFILILYCWLIKALCYFLHNALFGIPILRLANCLFIFSQPSQTTAVAFCPSKAA